MNRFKVSITENRYRDILSQAELRSMDTSIAKSSCMVTDSDFKKFVILVGKCGYPFCPSTFKEGIKSKKTFAQSQLLALYFDITNIEKGKASYDKIYDRAKRYELPVLFTYDSYSQVFADQTDRKCTRFCFVFLLSVPLADLKEAEAVQKALMMIFPEADKSCSVLKTYQGGNRVLYADKTIPTLDIEWLFMKMCLCLRDRYGDTNYKRKIAEFSKETGVALNVRKLPDVFADECHAEVFVDDINDKNSPNSTIVLDRNGEKLSNLMYYIKFSDECNNKRNDRDNDDSSEKKRSSKHGDYRSDDLKHLSTKCELYQEFKSGKRKLSQHELFGLATNLVRAESGRKMFISILRSERYYYMAEKYEDWNYQFYYLKDKEARPCASFCPYHDTCPHGRDIFSTCKPKYHQIERIMNCDIPLARLEEAEEDLRESFLEAIKSDEKIWHVIRCQTAIGKTQLILGFLRDTGEDVLVAVPTNVLKREECERAEEMGVHMVSSPSLHELKDELPEDVWDDIETLYARGRSPMPLLNKMIAENDERCVKLVKHYKKELIDFTESDCAITTHRRLTTMDVSKYDLVIVDEDIIYSTIIPNRETIAISKLKKLKKKLVPKDPLAAKIQDILNKGKKADFFTVDEVEYDESYDDIKMEVNIPALCSAKYFCYREASDHEEELTEDCISFVVSVEFPKNKKYIMLSATADRNICEYYFGEDNVKFYDCKEAAITGNLNQYGDRSMSREFMKKRPNIIEKIKKWTGVKNTISFKKYDRYCTGGMHFGNCAGCDVLKNKDIDVIGTPHQAEWIYKLFAYSLGCDVDENIKHNTIVENNGFRFRFSTYNDKVLRNIQFYMIESELEQAVGRARLLRYDCTVNLFSNFPLRQAVMKESEYTCD